MRKLFIVLLLTSLVGCFSPGHVTDSLANSPAMHLPDGIEFIEKVERKNKNQIVIPYSKYRLANGLTVLIHEDHSDPLVHVDVTYHVGSAREAPGQTGFAHFFEHMMFQGSEHVADEEHFKIVTGAGGKMNGTTSLDRTNYFETVPSNYLSQVLWLEADRMGFLLNAVTQEKFEVQRETVKNERGQRVDNQPYGRLEERVIAALYPQGHPYSWPTIGYIEDLNRVNVEDLKQFFLRWYGPNNAILTIGGDVEVSQVLTLVNTYFGTIPSGPAVEKAQRGPVTLAENRYISMEDNVHLPLIYMAFPTVSLHHPDEPALDILSRIIGGSKNSLLYQNLVKSEIAVQVNANHPCTELVCRFNLYALPAPGKNASLGELEILIRNSIDEFVERGVQDDDLIKIKMEIEASFIFGLQSVHSKVSVLASNELFSGDANYLEKDIARYSKITKADVQRVFDKYIKDKPAVIMSVLPEGGKNRPAKPDNFTPPDRLPPAVATAKDAALPLRPVIETLDRQQKPPAGPAVFVDVPAFWQHRMDNGIKVLGSQSTEAPTTAFLLQIPAGQYFEDKSQAGVATLLAMLLNESSQSSTAEQIANRLEKLGSQISITAGDEYIQVQVTSLTKNLKPTLKILQERLFSPAFETAEFNRAKKMSLEAILNDQKQPEYLLKQAFGQLMFGDTILGYPSQGTTATVSGLDSAAVVNFYQRHFKPDGAQLIVVSDLPEAAIKKQLRFLKQWQGKGPSLDLQLPLPPADKAGVIYLVNKENAVQAGIRIGKRGLKEDITGEFYRTKLMNFILGGNFNSRLNLNLREEKGYTYGATSSFWGDQYAGGFSASAMVRADVTDLALKEFFKEISHYQQQGMTAAELAFLRSAVSLKDALNYETPGAKLKFLSRIVAFDLTADFVQQQAQIVREISQAEILSLAQKHLDLSQMVIVVVGDAKTLRPKLETLGYPVVDYSLNTRRP